MAVEQTSAPRGRVMSQRARTLFRIFTATHVWLYRMSGGRLGGNIPTGPVLLLTTIGRKTGKRRTTPLIYLADGERMAIVGSAGGLATDPTWVLNLRAYPEVLVEVGRRTLRMRAETAEGAERERLWPLLTEMYHGFEEMQQATTRRIPVIVLSPIVEAEAS